MILEIFALIVLGVLCAAAIWLIVLIGNIPGNIARTAEHPQAEAISILAWVGLLTGGIGWGLALVWAKIKPAAPNAELLQRVAALEEKLKEAEA
ncbi:DUF3302 domain-containing protein [Halioglobus maricola]|uniref:DUF3302 domain-containing protein n=1 Tax=Halioglobus maricola TaxID=2601894 RepID=A0A5P9NNR2_9GAMM|nr:DUF3302 domain-containing protein [Halioglobus maricola]QFU77299.1 DUF3302 domain-containing protein [Halioglobus maricola]